MTNEYVARSYITAPTASVSGPAERQLAAWILHGQLQGVAVTSDNRSLLEAWTAIGWAHEALPGAWLLTLSGISARTGAELRA